MDLETPCAAGGALVGVVAGRRESELNRSRTVQEANDVLVGPGVVVRVILLSHHRCCRAPCTRSRRRRGVASSGSGGAKGRERCTRTQATESVLPCRELVLELRLRCAFDDRDDWLGAPDQYWRMWCRECWRSISRSQEGRSRPFQCVS